CCMEDPSFHWNLPTQNPDGTWSPGEWMPAIEGELRPCYNGYHLAENAHVLEFLGPRILEPEHRGAVVGTENKIVVRECRLLREFTGWNERIARLFAVWCAREALKLVSQPDPSSAVACDVAERFANGETTAKELAAAFAPAWAAASDAEWPGVSDPMRYATRAAAYASAWFDDAFNSARAAAWAAARDVTWRGDWAPEGDPARALARDVVRAAQYRQFCVMIGIEGVTA
ncbi:MAG: hypothetical protein WC718_19360, partial [Phycisphaerales bacterium]